MYPYCSLQGEEYAEKVRFSPKSFRWRVRTEKGYRWNLGDVRPGLYRWPDLLEAPQVLISEGEKSVDRLVRAGFTATCPPLGAGTWRQEWSLDL